MMLNFKSRLRALYARMPRWVRKSIREARSSGARRRALEALRRPPSPAEPHGLLGELVVSLTSYPPRFASLHLTLQSLLRQSVKPDRIVVWIAHADLASVPESVNALRGEGLEIRGCEDLRSFKKLVPALQTFPEAYIVTADDDLYFPPDWLQVLLARRGDWITARRAHRVVADDSGKLRPYVHWPPATEASTAGRPRGDLLPTTGAGVLFPPGSLHPDATNRELFEALCPDGDDLWFYWCAQRAGTLVRLAGPPLRLVTWEGSQDQSLWDANRLGGNDRMIARLEAAYGRALLEPDGQGGTVSG